jgi:hypothetical protein
VYNISNKTFVFLEAPAMKKLMIPALAGLLLLITAATSAAEKENDKVEPVLPANPEVLAKLKALGENSSCVLGNPKIIEKLEDFAKGWHRMKETGPCGRDYSNKMAWMPDRGRAFFCGANHGSPHRFNDAWEYDLPSNTWVLLYVPDYNDRGKITDYDKKTLVVKDGWLRTKKGGPAHPAHTWWGLTYDPTIKAAVWYCAWPSYRLKAKLDCIGAKKADLYKGPPIWVFYLKEKKWQPMPTAKPWARTSFGASLEYVPMLGGSLWQHHGGSWLLKAKEKTWKALPKSKVSLPIETLICHDPGRKIMIAHIGPRKNTMPRTWHFSLADGGKKGWVKVAEDNALPNGHDARSLMYFDPTSKKPLLYEIKQKQLWSYDPDAKKWEKLKPAGPPPPFKDREKVVGFFDTIRNVFTVVGYNSVWCYRSKKVAGK